MSPRLLNAITYSASEYMVSSKNGKGGSVFHQTYPVRYFNDLRESGFYFGIAVYDSSPTAFSELSTIKIALYQYSLLIGEDEIPCLNEKVSVKQLKKGKVMSWVQGVATENASEGLVKLKVSFSSMDTIIEVDGENHFYLEIGDANRTNSYLAFFLNILCKFSQTYRNYIFNRNNRGNRT